MGVAARRKLSAADVKRIRRRVRAGEYQTDIAPEYGVNRRTIRRRLDALERAESERAARLAEKRRGRQAAREKRKLRDRERDTEAAPLEPSRPRGRLSQQRTSVRNPEHEWLARRKNLSGDARAEASGLVRVRLPDRSARKWVEREEVEPLLDAGWLLDDSPPTNPSRSSS